MRYLRYLFIGACLFAGTPGFAQSQAPVSPAPDYAVLRAQSAALSKADRARAKQLFATAFTLWQSGDFAAAELAFKQGLAIDPANAQANYYYGDCLVRRKDRKDAENYLARSAAFSNGSTEGFKAQAELQLIEVAPIQVDEMSAQQIRNAIIGTWQIKTRSLADLGKVFQTSTAVISLGTQGGLQVSGPSGYQKISLDGTHIVLIAPHDFISDTTLDGALLTPTHMEGTGSSCAPPSNCRWEADKTN